MPSGACRDECGYLLDPHTACGVVAAERALGAAGATPQVVLSTAHPAKFPDAIEAITGERPALPERLAGLLTAHERFAVIDNDLSAAERLVESVDARDQRGRGMTPTISTLPNGLRVVTAGMPQPGDGVARAVGRRRRTPRDATASTASRTSSSTWPSRERSGAARSEIAEEIEEVGGELNAATSLETTAYFARVLKGDEGVALGLIADILQNSAFGAPGARGRARR